MLCRLATLKYDHELHGFPEETLRAAQAAGSLLEVRERWFEQGGVQHVALLLLFDEAGVAVATTRIFRAAHRRAATHGIEQGQTILRAR